MNWLRYLAEANLYLGIFYLCYCLFLSKETHYLLNRIYILFACILSFIIPVVQLGILKPSEAQSTYTALHLPLQYVALSHTPVGHRQATNFVLQDYVLYAYLLGVAILLVLLTFKLYQLLKLTRTKYIVTNAGYKLIYICDSNTAFSFFNYLFVGTNTPQVETIIRHELVHIRQKHSFDIILLEVIKIINWFNPLIYLLQKSLKTIHD